jgi:hypothetical protein
VLKTLLVLWVVVVPVLTLAGTYLVSGVLGRSSRTRGEHPLGVAPAPVSIATSRPRRAPIRIRARDHANRPRDHAFIPR